MLGKVAKDMKRPGRVEPYLSEDVPKQLLRIPTKLHSCSDVVEHWS